MEVVSLILADITGKISVIDKLIEAVATYVGDSYKWKTELKEDLLSLRLLLPQIHQIAVHIFERRLTSYEATNGVLMKPLMKFSYEIDEAEEVLDELEYLKLKKKFNRDNSRLSRAVDASFRVGKRFLKWDDVPERLRTCVKNLKTSAPKVEMLTRLVSTRGVIFTIQMQQEILPLTNNSKITSSLSALSFKGREEEKGSIIQYLLGESAGESEIQKSENVHCLPLVAMGGMGKTALAQQVFNHFENVNKEHFHIKIWVRVSTDFNASSLMKKILESSIGQSESEPSELIPVKLKEILRSNRFLLVLDDAWDDNNLTEWEKLCAPLLYGQKGSWVILTTTKKSVANMVSNVIRGTMEPMMLQGLSKDVCRTLLYERAFAGRDQNEFPWLKEIGEEIVDKLNGIPLLAKSIGGALNSNLEPDHWESISRSEVWKMPKDSRDEFIPALKLSYLTLPPDLKRCFSYCGIFPQDYKFNKQKLVCMWVAAGLIYSDGSKEGSDETIANCCFDMLWNKSFFDVHTYDRSSFTSFYDTAKDFYTMHDLLHSLARHVSRYECCRIVDVPPTSFLDYKAIRHISISITSTDAQHHDLANMVCKLKHLRTLWIEYDGDPQELDDFIRDACKSPRRIRVLIIKSSYSRVSCQCLESIGDFVKLRYLDISAHWQPPSLSLSMSICKFYFLQVLIGNGDYPILTKDANKFTNLRHLYGVREDALLSVAEVGKLTSLQELCFSVGTELGYRIDELMNMNKLQQLKIQQLSNVRSPVKDNEVNLVSKKNLTRLELHYRDGMFHWDRASNPDLVQQGVLAALRPPHTIRELLITHYKGGKPAPWMDTSSLSWLESLELYDCTSLGELPPLWELPCLKFLKLDRLEAIRSLGCHSSSDKQFPLLEELKFVDLPLLEEWNGADDYIWFPHLRTLQIENCPKLKKIPDLPLSIENLQMVNLCLEVLPRSTFGGFQQLMSLESLEIYKYTKIIQIGSIGEEDDNLLPSSLKKLKLGGFLDQHEVLASYLRGLTSLTDLSLICSLYTTSLPLENELEHLSALRRLNIMHGKALTSPGGLYIIKSLKYLKIHGCPKFLSAEDESQEFLKDKTKKSAESSSSVSDRSANNKAASILPSSLESLTISYSDISQESLGRCFRGLTSLEELQVSDCHHLVSLPNVEYLHNLTALRTLHIFDCKELCELESLTALVSLRQLKIMHCPKLLATTCSTLQSPAATTEQSATEIQKETFPSLEQIYMDNIFYLPILPISERLKTVCILNETENSRVPTKFTCFPSEIEHWLLQCRESLEVLELGQMPHLQYLPANLESFSSLEVFRISHASELKSLPRMPASLETMMIDGCSAELMKHCQEDIGPDWPNIQHILHIHITVGKEDKAE